MPVIPLFLFKLSISLSIVWIFYQLLLRRLTFYQLNRWYLLGYTVLAFFIPLINIGPMLADVPSGVPMMVEFIPAIGHVQANAVSLVAPRAVFSGWNGLLLLLLLGMLLLLIRSAVRWFSLLRLRRQARRVEGTELKIYQVDAPIIPFSFGNAIYINQRLHTEKEWSDIILHEYIHIRQRHTVDMLLTELVCILNWYNPFSWLIRYSVRQNLEFIADQQVLDNGVDRKGYQYHLLKVVGEPRYRLANSFNFSSLKKRIVMMNKMRSARVHLLKLLFLVPLVAILLLAFRDRYTDLFGPHGPVYVNAAGIAISVPERTPLEGVVVRDRVTGLQTTTDANGFYKLQIPFKGDPGRVDLDYIKAGYDSDYRERHFPTLKESTGILDVAVLRQLNDHRPSGLTGWPSGYKAPADPDYADAKNELHRVLKENDDLMRYMQLQKDHPEVSLFYETEDRQKEIIVHTDGTIERYGYPGTPSPDEMKKKYGDMQGYMATSHPEGHLVNSGYLARWAAIAEEAQREFHTTNPNVRAIIFPGDSRVIVVPVAGKTRFYDMDSDAENERVEFERLCGKLPNCVPTAGNNTPEKERKAGRPVASAAGPRDTVPGGGDSARRRIQLIGIVEGKPDSVPPLYIVDGKPMPPDWEIGVIPVEMVGSINVIGPGPAAAAYGERAKHGALLLTTKDPGHDWSKEKGSGGMANAKITEDHPVHHWDLASFPKFNGGEPVLLIDGKVVPLDSLKMLSPDGIKEIHVYKDSAMASRFGAKGRSGVVSVHTKDWKIPLLFVDGREVDWDSAGLINPSEIESMNVLKAEEARPKYGEKGKNGVMLITLKAKRPDSEN